MRRLGAEAAEDGAVYLTGGATAVLLGWRASTLDVDVLLLPEQESVLRAIPRLKDELRVNVETASPRDFVPVPAGWEDRSIFAVSLKYASARCGSTKPRSRRALTRR
jgi:hypothetical protein